MENTNPTKEEAISFDKILFAIVNIGGQGYQVIMSGQHGEQELMANIGAHLALVAMQHHPFEIVLRTVVKALDNEREALQKELDSMDINKEVKIG